MERTKIKQRLVGAVVLVALGVIFIPMILTSDRDDDVPIFGSNIPEISEEQRRLKEMTIPEPVAPPPQPAETRNLVDEETPETPPEKTVSEKTVAPQPETTAKKDDRSALAYVVQVGSFKNRKSALKRKDELTKKNFNTFVESITTAEGTLYRVRVGPFVREEEARKTQKAIKQKTGFDCIVQKHP